MTIHKCKTDRDIQSFILCSKMFVHSLKKISNTEKEEVNKYWDRKMTVFASLNYKTDAFSLKTVWIVEKCRKRDKTSPKSPFPPDNLFFTSLYTFFTWIPQYIVCGLLLFLKFHMRAWGFAKVGIKRMLWEWRKDS